MALMLVSFGVLIGAFNTPVASAAPASSQLNFQARLLTNSGNLVPDGSYHIEFKLYKSLAAGASAQGTCVGGVTDDCVWMETRSTGNLVSVTNGYFSVNLGSVTSFGSLDWSQQYWLTMNIGGTSGPSWNGEMSPRIQLTTVPVAQNALGVNSGTTNAASTNSSAVTIQSGNALGTTSNSGNLTIDAGSATGTAGTISLGATNASSLLLGRAGFSTTNVGNIVIQGGSATLGTTTQAGSLVISDGSSNTVTLTASGIGTNYSLTLPTAAGSTSQCLQTDASVATQLIFASCGAGGSGVTTIGAIDTTPTSANGARISGTSIFMQYGDGTYPGLISATTQTIAGVKTFNSNIILAAAASLKVTGDITTNRPSSPTEGQVWFDTTTKKLIVYSNGKWQADRSTATFIVAASDSSQAIKDAADYVADGNTGTANDGDQVQINAAITAAYASGAGGKVYLAEGNYLVDAAITMQTGVTLEGSGSRTKLKADLGAGTYNVINTAGANIIKLLSIDGQSPANYVSGVQHGIYIADGADDISNVTVANVHDAGIYLASAATNSIHDSSINGNGYDVYISGSTDNKITNNNFNDSNYGVYLTGTAAKVLVSGNRFTLAQTSAIYAASTTTRAIISNNVFYEDGTGSVDAFDFRGSYSTISGNTVTDPTNSPGMTFTGASFNTISNNNLYNSDGIKLTTSSNNNIVTGNIISGGIVSASNNLISITSSDNNSITNNVINDNSCTTTCYAINITDSASDNNYLADNKYGVTAGTNQASINDAGTGTRFASQLTAAQILQSGSSFIKANASSPLTGTGAIVATTALNGSGTKFTTELQVGDRVTVNSETRTVVTITSDIAVVVDTAFNTSASLQTITRLPAALQIANSSGANIVSVNNIGGATFQNSSDSTAAFRVQNASGITLLGINSTNGATTISGIASGSSTALTISNSTSTGSILIAQDNSTTVFSIADGGLVTIQSTASLTSGQIGVTQTANIASTSGGTVRGYQFNSTIVNTTSAATNIGFEINQTDNSTALANTNTGLKVVLSGSNTSQAQYGLEVSVTKGAGAKFVSSGVPTAGITCGGASGALSIAVCADNTNSASTDGVGLYARSSSLATSILGLYAAGSGAYGVNSANTASGKFVSGVTGETSGTGTAGTSIGVYGKANAGAGATTYGGYFTLSSTSGSTAGAALYGSNSSIATNILQLQDNTSDVLVLGDGGSFALTPSDVTKTIVLGATGQTGSITIGQATTASTQTIKISSENSTSSTQTIEIGGGTSTSAGGKVVNIANGVPGASTTNTVAIGTQGGATGTVGVTVGSIGGAAHTTTIQGGNGTTAINIQTAASGSINVGTNAVTGKIVNIGSVGTTANATTVHIADSSDATVAQSVTIGSNGNASSAIVLQSGSTNGVTVKTAASATSFQVQNASSNMVLGVNTSTNQVLIGKSASVLGSLIVYNATNANTITIQSGTTGTSYTLTLPTTVGSANDCLQNSGTAGVLTFAACGTGGAGSTTKHVTLHPEYAGATLYADGTNNTGNMTSDYDSTNRFNYYEWTSTQATSQDYDIVIRYTLPSDFNSTNEFKASSWKVRSYVTNTTNAAATITVISAAGTSCITAESIKPASNTTWTQKTLTTNPNTACTFAANDDITIQIKLSSQTPSTDKVRVSDIVFEYDT